MLINGIVPKLMSVRREIIRVMRMRHAQIQLAHINVNVRMVILVMDENVCLFVIHRVLMVVSVSHQMNATVGAATRVLHARKI